MMYEFGIRTELTDTQDSPKKTVLKLTEGIIHQLDIESYPGSMGYLYGAIYHGGHQVWPTNPDGCFRLGGVPISGKERYELTIPAELYVYTWLGTGAENYHDVRVRIWILREDELGTTIRWTEETEKLYGGE